MFSFKRKRWGDTDKEEYQVKMEAMDWQAKEYPKCQLSPASAKEAQGRSFLTPQEFQNPKLETSGKNKHLTFMESKDATPS